jgi:hypothetical protein
MQDRKYMYTPKKSNQEVKVAAAVAATSYNNVRKPSDKSGEVEEYKNAGWAYLRSGAWM